MVLPWWFRRIAGLGHKQVRWTRLKWRLNEYYRRILSVRGSRRGTEIARAISVSWTGGEGLVSLLSDVEWGRLVGLGMKHREPNRRSGRSVGVGFISVVSLKEEEGYSIDART